MIYYFSIYSWSKSEEAEITRKFKETWNIIDWKHANLKFYYRLPYSASYRSFANTVMLQYKMKGALRWVLGDKRVDAIKKFFGRE
jgi:hypothetical protein